jgi:hypothetical protein
MQSVRIISSFPLQIYLMVTFCKFPYASVFLVSGVTVLAACLRVINFSFQIFCLFLSEVSACSRRTFFPCFYYCVLCLVITAVEVLVSNMILNVLHETTICATSD